LCLKADYCEVIEDMPSCPKISSTTAPGARGIIPAVWEFMKTNYRFEIDKEIENKLLITVAPCGYLKCVG